MGSVNIRFYAELNDFLPDSKKNKSYGIEDFGKRTVKDLIQSQGVPHAEVDLILINGEPANFNKHVKPNDYISVYPVFESFDISSTNQLRKNPLRQLRFMLDVHLGKLAKYLRMLGFNSLYFNDFDDEEIVLTALLDNRIILTRDIGLLKRSDVEKGYWIRSTFPKPQLAEVLKRFDLFQNIEPFRICMHCNGIIKPINKKEVEHRLQADTLRYYTKFYTCSNCNKIYWKGSHHNRMMRFVKEIQSNYTVQN
jgi:uncharacterized protein with PIN domain